MACRYTYKGKTYSAAQFDDVLRALPISVAEKFMPSVAAAKVQAKDPHTISTLAAAIDKAMGDGFTKLLEETGKFKLITSDEIKKYLGQGAKFSVGDTSQYLSDLERTMGSLKSEPDAITVSDTSDALLSAGAKRLPITISKGVIQNSTGIKPVHHKVDSAHTLSMDDIKRLPELLADPIMVFESTGGKGSLVVLVDAKDEKGNNAVIAIELNRKEKRHEVNSIRSAYGKDSAKAIIQWIEGTYDGGKGKPLLRYWDKQRSLEWMQTRGVQFSKVATNQGVISNVISKDDLVNSGSKFSKASHTDTPAFRKWFGASKVVDANGNPLVVYHGTPEKFNEFDGEWHFFAEELKHAKGYGKNIVKAYLRADNLFDYAKPDSIEKVRPWVEANIAAFNETDEDVTGWEDEDFEDAGIDPFWAGNTVDKVMSAYKDGVAFQFIESVDGFVDELKRLGFDGFTTDEDGRNYAVFESSQIKSVDNNGQFDSSSPDIRYSKDGRILAFVVNGQTYMVADNISKTSDSVKGLLHHEIGVHALRLGRTEEEFKKILRRFKAMKVMGSKKVKAAYARVPSDTPAHLVDEEALGYFTEANTAHTLAQQFISFIRTMLRKIGDVLPIAKRLDWVKWANKLSEGDILDMVASTTKHAPDMLGGAESRGTFKSGQQRAESFARVVLEEMTAGNDLAFSYKKTSSKTITGAIADVVDGAEYLGDLTRADEVEQSGADMRQAFKTDDDKLFYVYSSNDGRVWIDVSRLEKTGIGGAIYAAIGNYAFNSHKKFAGDPDGLSPIAVIRRTHHMLSSALRFGTTRHLDAPTQQRKGTDTKGNRLEDVEPLDWTGSDIDRIEAMVQTITKTAENFYPSLKDFYYDFNKQQFDIKPDRRGSAGNDRQDYDVAGVLRALNSSGGQAATIDFGRGKVVGQKTARRVLVLRSLLDASGESELQGLQGRSAILERVLRWEHKTYPKNIERLFSRAPSGNDDRADTAGNAAGSQEALGSNKRLLREAKASSLEQDTSLIDKIASAPFKLVGWNRLFEPAIDSLLAKLGELVPEKVKAGVVSDYGIDQQYSDRKSEMKVSQAMQSRKVAGLVEMLAGLNRAESRVAHAWMTTKPNEVSDKQLMEALPKESIETLQTLRKMIDDLSLEAVRLGQLSQDSYNRNRFAYLHRVYQKNVIDTEGIIAKTLRARSMKVKGDHLKGRGIFAEVSMSNIGGDKMFWRKLQAGRADGSLLGEKMIRFERRDASTEVMDALPGMTSKPIGKLREVVYWPSSEKVPAMYGDWLNAGTFEVRDTRGDKLVMWRDYTKEERVRMGEIDDVRYTVAMTLQMMVHDIEVGRFFDWNAKQYGRVKLTSEHEVPASESMASAFKKDDWVKVPEATVSNTGGVRKYGALAGMYIPAPIWNDIRQINGWQPSSEFWKYHEATLQFWKKAKTAWSPAVHMNNVMSNFVIADWHDLRATDLAEALKVWALNNKDGYKQIYQRFEDSGALGGMFLSNEALRNEIAMQLETMKAELTGEQEAKNEMAKMAKLMHMITMVGMVPVKGAKAYTKGAEAAYQFEDAIFRLAAFTKAIRYGKSDIEAGRIAQHSFLNYDINAPWIQGLRHSALPFVSFFYRALPMLLQTVKSKPWKVVKLLAFWHLASALGALIAGGDDDDEESRKILPEQKRGSVWGVVPKMVRMPWNSDTGAPIYLDIRRWVPVGDVVDFGQNESILPPWATPGGVIPLVAEVLVFNKSVFTGKDIVSATDSFSEGAEKRLDYLFKGMMPNVPVPNPINMQLPNGYEINPLGLDQGSMQPYAWSGVEKSLLKKENAIGEVRTPAMAGLNSVGVKVGAYPRQNMEAALGLDAKRQITEIEGAMRTIARNHSNIENPTEKDDERYAEALERQRKKLEKISDEYRERTGR